MADFFARPPHLTARNVFYKLADNSVLLRINYFDARETVLRPIDQLSDDQWSCVSISDFHSSTPGKWGRVFLFIQSELLNLLLPVRQSIRQPLVHQVVSQSGCKIFVRRCKVKVCAAGAFLGHFFGHVFGAHFWDTFFVKVKDYAANA